MKKKTGKKNQIKNPTEAFIPKELTVYEHLLELRSRLLFYLVCLCIVSGISYYFNSQIIQFLVAPLRQSLYYNNPAGALQFGIQVAVFLGFVLTLPLLVYQLVRFIEPVLPTSSKKFIDIVIFSSMILVFIGVSIAYFLIIPATLRFLTTFSTSSGIEALITVDQYFSFMTLYLGGFAVLFQLPLVMFLISRFTSATWKTFLHYQRYIIAIAFISAAILTPTPDVFNLMLFAAPIILLYYVSILVMFITARRK